MNIILGASGQVGSAVVDNLVKAKAAVRGIIRNPEHAHALAEKGAMVGIADSFDLEALETAFKDGSAVFVITPETGQSNDVLGDTEKLLHNYRAAIEKSGIKKIVGLSSIGAQHKEDSGNLKMSYMLEQAFVGLPAHQIFVRPYYYYSNWIPYFDSVKETGILSTFYPVDLKLSMVSPLDVAKFVSEVLVDDIEGSPVYEVEGPESLSSAEVAHIMGEVLGRKVEAQQIPEKKWGETLENMGFTIDATKNFLEMTQMVIEGKTAPEGNGRVPVKVETTFREYLTQVLQ